MKQVPDKLSVIIHKIKRQAFWDIFGATQTTIGPIRPLMSLGPLRTSPIVLHCLNVHNKISNFTQR